MGRMACALLLVATHVLCVHAQTLPVTPLRPGKVSIKVVDSVTGQPIAGAFIFLHNFSENRCGVAPCSRSLTQPTDKFGRWELDVLPGEYDFSIAPPIEYVHETGITRITVREDKTTEVPAVSFIPAGKISGRVLDELGNPIENAEIGAIGYIVGNQTRLWAGVGQASTDDQGHYELKGMRAGRVLVRVVSPFFKEAAGKGQRYATVYYPSADVPSQALFIDVKAGTTRGGIDFHVRPTETFHIRGAIAVPSNAGKTSFILQHCMDGDPAGGLIRWEQKFGEDGLFDLEEVIPGIYCLFFREYGTGGGVRFYAKQTVTVTDRDVEVHLIPEPTQQIGGVVRIDGGASLPMPRNVLLIPADGWGGHTAKIDSAGKFEFTEVERDDYSIYLNGDPGTYVKSIKFGYSDVTEGKFSADGQSGTFVVEIAAAKAQLKGKVNTGSRPPVSGIEVTAIPDGFLNNRNDRFYTATTNEQGEFLFTNIAPGAYKVYAWEKKLDEGWAWLPEFLMQFSTAAARVADNEESTIIVMPISSEEIEQIKATF